MSAYKSKSAKGVNPLYFDMKHDGDVLIHLYASHGNNLIEEETILSFNQYNGDSISGCVFNDQFEFFYVLESWNYSNGKRAFAIRGKTDTVLRCMDPVTKTNVDIGKLVYRLTGVLIILGTFPFIISLKKILEYP